MGYSITDKSSCSDIGLTVEGDTVEELFCQSAYGIADITAEPGAIREDIELKIELEEKTVEDLYYSWLSELIYYKDADFFLPKRCEIEIELTGETCRLGARLKGDRMDRTRHELKLDIKGVTFYNFRIEKIDGRWSGEVVFDL